MLRLRYITITKNVFYFYEFSNFLYYPSLLLSFYYERIFRILLTCIKCLKLLSVILILSEKKAILSVLSSP